MSSSHALAARGGWEAGVGPGLRGGEIGEWLVGLERGRYAAGERPPPLDDRAVRRIRALVGGRQTASPAFYANQFGRIGAGRG